MKHSEEEETLQSEQSSDSKLWPSSRAAIASVQPASGVMKPLSHRAMQTARSIQAEANAITSQRHHAGTAMAMNGRGGGRGALPSESSWPPAKDRVPDFRAGGSRVDAKCGPLAARRRISWHICSTALPGRVWLGWRSCNALVRVTLLACADRCAAGGCRERPDCASMHSKSTGH